MIKNYIAPTKKVMEYQELCFDDGKNNGFAFPYKDGDIMRSNMSEQAMANFEWCIQHPEKFERYNKLVIRKRIVRKNTHGTCKCGKEVILYDDYLGACSCPNCGQWYNLFGQELNDPTKWSQGEDW